MPRLAALIAAVPVYTAIGIGPMLAGRTVVDGFIGLQSEPWLSRTSLAIEWLLFTVLGYFFARTLAALTLDYEPFWRVPGCVTAFAALLSADEPLSPLRAYIDETRGELAEALHVRSLGEAGISSPGLDRLHMAYAFVRAGWLAGLVIFACLAIDLVRRAVGSDEGALLIGVLVAVAAAAITLTSVGTAIVGRGVARTAAELISERAATRSASPPRNGPRTVHL